MNEQYRVQVSDGVEYKYSSEWIQSLETKQHWEFYWYQQKLMEGLLVPGQDDILELGKGSGFAANYCSSQGLAITTLDIDEDKKPDIVANIAMYDFDKAPPPPESVGPSLDRGGP